MKTDCPVLSKKPSEDERFSGGLNFGYIAKPKLRYEFHTPGR